MFGHRASRLCISNVQWFCFTEMRFANACKSGDEIKIDRRYDQIRSPSRAVLCKEQPARSRKPPPTLRVPKHHRH